MDIVTLNKIISNFGDNSSCFIDCSFLESELDELKNLGILIEKEPGKYYLKRLELYKYAKGLSREGNFDMAIIIFNYLVNVQDKEWHRTIYYQLFKNYFYKKEYYKSYEAFKLGFDKKCELYPFILNMFDYILKRKHEYNLNEHQYLDLFVNKEFSEVKKMVLNSNIKANESQRKFFSVINEKAIEVEKSIDAIINNMIFNHDFDGLINYERKLLTNHQSNESIRLLVFIANVYLLLKNDKSVNKEWIEQFFDILNVYQSNTLDKVLKDYNISSKYSKCLDHLLKEALNNLARGKYNSYFIKYAKKNLKKLDNIIVLDNLADYNNELYLKLANKTDNSKISTIISGNNKKIVINHKNDYEDIDFSRINQLYLSKDYKECIKNCLKFINQYPYYKEAYDVLIKCYSHYGNKIEEEKYIKLRNLLFNNNGYYLSIDDEAKFYGINNIKDIICFINRYNISVEIACLNYGLSEKEIEIVKLLISKYYYCLNDTINGNLYYNSVDDDNIVINYLKKEIDNPNYYSNIDYNEAKEVINLLELKK